MSNFMIVLIIIVSAEGFVSILQGEHIYGALQFVVVLLCLIHGEIKNNKEEK